MAQYIDKSAVVAEIKGLIRANELYLSEPATDAVRFQKTGAYSVLNDLLHFLDTIEMKEMENEELTSIEKKVVEGTIARLDRKRVPIQIRGELKAKFRNEFNTVWQLIDGIKFAHVAKHIIERVCLHFATWGSYNLKGMGQIIDKDKLELPKLNKTES